jgi:ATP-dependent DNA ligase
MAVGNALNAGSLARPMLPRVQPIAPIRKAEPFNDPEWVFDVKYDGFRGICYLKQGCCRMISRNGNLMSRFASLGDKIAASLEGRRELFDRSPRRLATGVR